MQGKHYYSEENFVALQFYSDWTNIIFSSLQLLWYAYFMNSMYLITHYSPGRGVTLIYCKRVTISKQPKIVGDAYSSNNIIYSYYKVDNYKY